ncbi:MAG: energy transducer TonB [Deltaproteobacteria bacterium]|nr:energy transducer TonB [Candidatus Anaeroferrophillus wilburensis]MBN2889880.1 energy transducer TonB [Deltaproteobacteria bacterium]
MSVTSRIIVFSFISILLHLSFLFVLPDISHFFAIHLQQMQLLPETKIEVMLLPPEPEPVSAPPAGPNAPDGPRVDSRIISLVEERINAILALGDVPVPAPKELELPSSSFRPAEENRIIAMTPSATDTTADFFAELGSRTPGDMSGVTLQALLPAGYLESQDSEQRLLAALQQDVDQQENFTAVKNRILGLEGPVAESRTVVSQPALPQVSLQQETEVKLKFWLRPDGTVGRVEPLVIGDLALVKVAEIYLKAWRFNTLSPDDPHSDQWGTITIRFAIK